MISPLIYENSTMNLTYIADHYAVSPQIQIEDVATLKESGFIAIVCNRPDGEDDGQPSFAQISAEAKANGMGYIHLPMSGPIMTHDQLEQLEVFLDDNDGKVFSYCRSGNRSSIMYAALLEKCKSE